MNSNPTRIELTIDRNPEFLGDVADAADMERYRDLLEAEIQARYPDADVTVRMVSGGLGRASFDGGMLDDDEEPAAFQAACQRAFDRVIRGESV